MPADAELQAMYDELKRRGLYKSDPEMQAMGHELRKRGLVSDPTQGGMVSPKQPALASERSDKRQPDISPAKAVVGKPAPPPSLIGRVGQGFDTAMRVISRPAEAVTAGVNEWGRAAGDTRHLSPLTAIPQAATRAINAAGDVMFGPLDQPTVQPVAIREALGMERGKTNRLAYNVASVADYLTAAALDPSNFLTPGASLSKAVGKVPGVKQAVAGLGKAGARIAETKPVSAAVGAVRGLEQAAQRHLLSPKSTNPYTELVALQKQVFLSNPGTQSANLLGNTAAMEMALRRSGVGLSKLPGAAKQAMVEARQAAKGGIMSQDIAELSHYLPDFGQSLNKTLKGAPGSFSAKMGDRNWFLRIQGMTEEASKLTLFKALKAGGLSPEDAAKAVKVHLLDYTDVPALLQIGDKYGVAIFASFPYAAGKLFLDTLQHRPDLIARFPRLQRQLMQEFPGAQAAYEKLPAFKQGPFVFPTGDNTFVDFARSHPINQFLPFLTAESGSLVPSNVFNPSFQAAKKTPEGGPQQDRLMGRIGEEVKARVPLARTAVGLVNSVRGLANTDYRNAEAQTPAQAILQYIAGIGTSKGETRAEAGERLSPAIQKRSEAASRIMATVDKGLSAGKQNPMVAEVASLNNDELQARHAEVEKYLRRLSVSPRFSDKNGNITPEGKGAIRRGYLLLKAIEGAAGG